MGNDPRRNADGYYDPTAYRALRNIEAEKRFRKLLRAIFDLCQLSGFVVEGRIMLRDEVTGRLFK
jgi:hypothetical protein